ncbi:DnaJ sub C member 8 [Emydomyces testavorans]|uniref:DnaJ sub C member 8 n=1 Tax=Emydomyces testavorans TaxID=2070801 RepID=A0AAF0DFU9_9EURO|nr:DnaJ sub C member 8 [Emydomyces testavorans]
MAVDEDLEALNSLEKEASEFTKVRNQSSLSQTPSLPTRLKVKQLTPAFSIPGRRNRPHSKRFPTRRVRKSHSPLTYSDMSIFPLTNPSHKSYAVLDLQPGVPDSDIKVQYRKKSLLIHPDKTSNPLAPDAFDRLNKAQTTLLDEKARAHLDECIADARRLLIREHKYSLDSPELKTDEFKAEWRKKTVHVLLEEEARRRRQLKAKLQEEGREKRKEDEEMEARKRKREEEKAWEESRDDRIGSWRDWQKGRRGKGEGDKEGGKKKKKMKVLG